MNGEYKYTFNPHFNFFPYTHSFLRAMIPVPENHICKDIKRDIYYMETMNEPAANTQPIAARMSGIAPPHLCLVDPDPFCYRRRAGLV